ncbi:MAG: YwqG family protein [Gammaproteobacteria bacterium]|nr:YwqG family protein [Gammaproteobacteria bacterium]
MNYIEQAISVKKPALHLVASETNGLKSKLGGKPWLPKGTSWPSWKGKSLSFLAQISLSEIPDNDVIQFSNNKGLLYFFYDQDQSTWGFDPKDKGSWKVIYSPDENVEGEREFPSDVGENSRFKESPIFFEKIDVYPSDDRVEIDYNALSDQEFDSLLDDWENLLNSAYRGKSKHQIGGYPYVVQGDYMASDAELALKGVYLGDGDYVKTKEEKQKAEEDWTLLLQVDTDSAPDMMWGDMGLLYFWVRKEDLIENNYEDVWLILQCS